MRKLTCLELFTDYVRFNVLKIRLRINSYRKYA